MEANEQEIKSNKWEARFERNHTQLGRILAGFVLIGIGVVLFLERMGYFFPSWVFSWKMLLIAIGVFVGAKHTFKGFGWLIPIIIGVLFLFDDFFPGFAIRAFIWPIIITIIGLLMIFRPKRHDRWRHKWRSHYHKHHKNYEHYTISTDDSESDRVDAVVVFGTTKKNIISKNFKGGEVTCVFGGSEINLMQADMNGRLVLEINQVFGGTKLLIPAHWQIVSETVTFMGSVEDKRPDNKNTDATKVLLIRGSSIFGSIDIVSF